MVGDGRRSLPSRLTRARAMTFDPASLRQTWPQPSTPTADRHHRRGLDRRRRAFPRLSQGGFPIAGVFDLDAARAQERRARSSARAGVRLARRGAADDGAIFDLATPPAAHHSVLERIAVGRRRPDPEADGRRPRRGDDDPRVCRERKLVAAVNFQLRFAPMMLAVQGRARPRACSGGSSTSRFASRSTRPGACSRSSRACRGSRSRSTRSTISTSSAASSAIPAGVHAKTIGHPSSDMAQTRTAAILDYGDEVRSAMSSTTTTRSAGGTRSPEFRFEGIGRRRPRQARRAARLSARRARRTLRSRRRARRTGFHVPLHGGWFPDAFVGRMANLQRFVARRGQGPDRLGRGRLDDHGAGRGGVRIERPARDAASRSSVRLGSSRMQAKRRR